MAKLFKNIKSLFIIEEEGATSKKPVRNKQQPENKQKKATPNSPSPKSAPPPAANPSSTVSPGKVTQKFTNVLLRAMEQNNLEGFDYLEFKQSLNSLKKMPMDESTRFQSAFAMAQTMGATPAVLLQAAQHYLDILKREESKFEDALSKQKMKQIGSKEQAVKKLEESIQAKAAKIKELTQQIEAHQKEMAALKGAIQESAVKVESTKNDFIASYNNLLSQIQQDMEGIKQYLK